uniref:protein-tyrosine-phosphatase n=1 Tax=Leptobrachium leishanense TaxID=445787 RepID=A0A8C5QWD0_9ANUR
MEKEFREIDEENRWSPLYVEIRYKSPVLSNKIAKNPENRSRNRYRDVNPYDHSRIKLQNVENDYINASLVVVEEAQRNYILTQRLNLPTLSEDISHQLTFTPSLGELQAALSSLKANKAPGPDGYTDLYYKTFFPQLNSHLLSALSHIFRSGGASSDWLSATIVTIPKTIPPEDNCSKYRPISLLNVDAKLYAKILAKRLADIMPVLIADDQVGFIKSRQGPDNTIKAMTLMDHVLGTATPSLILSLDAEKAFDRLHWVFLEHTLLKFNFPTEFIKAIMALYSCPNARVLNAGFQSTVIPITNGTRQGCPISPLLYALALEPLAQAIRQSDGIEGLMVGPTVCKLSLFADDLLLTLTNPLTSLPTLPYIILTEWNLSYHKINVHKTQALSYGIPDAELTTLKSQYPYDWRNRSLKYLGIKLSFNKTQMYKLNYAPLIHTVSTLCQQWSTVEMSWVGRINAIKMILLPKILYVFRALPLTAPMSFFKTVLSNLSQFIWRGKRPRIKIAILHQPVDRGGLGLPNILLYYRAALMSNLGRIFAGINLPQWTSLILPCSLPHDFGGLLWTPRSCRLIRGDLPALPALLMRVWDVTRSLLTAVHPLSLASSIAMFTHLIPDFDPRPWCRNSLNTLSSFYASHDILPFLQLQERHSLHRNLGFHFMRLRSCLAKYGLLRLPPNADILTRFEQYCLTPSPDSRLLSLTYQTLLTRAPISAWRFQLNWERDLQRTLSADQWRDCFSLDCKKFRCISLVEARKKILYRWYITPDREHHYNPQVPRTCWRCEEEEGTFFHTWWTCPRLTPLWDQVAALSSEILDAELVPSPEVFLLQMFPDSLTKFQKQLLAHILSATTTLIAAKWKSNVIPTVGAVKTRISELRSLDAMARALMGLTGVGKDHWSIWDTYTGPLPNTCCHFWLMVWQQKSHAVVMLNRIIEKDAVKCAQYWPTPEEEVLLFKETGLCVKLLSEDTKSYYTVRSLQLQNINTSEVREIYHFHYTTWPDFGVPESPASFLNFLFKVRDSGSLDPTYGPCVVHCSAGIGRSGTFSLVDTCLVLMEKRKDPTSVDIKDVLLNMRHFRMGLIQTPGQLRFSYMAVIEGAKYITGDGSIQNKWKELSKEDHSPKAENCQSLQRQGGDRYNGKRLSAEEREETEKNSDVCTKACDTTDGDPESRVRKRQREDRKANTSQKVQQMKQKLNEVERKRKRPRLLDT